MGNELQVPDSFKNGGMSSAFQAALNAQEDSLSEGIGQSYGVIGYKGKVWSIRYRGERKTVIRPDDGTPSGYIDVIVLGQAKTKSKSFYKTYDAATSDGDRPICSSMNGITPDDDVQVKQSDHCALCERNKWKPDPVTGRKGRECTDYKRLAVLVLPTQTQPIFGTPLVEPLFLRVPPDSLNSLAIMGDTMTAQGHHHSSFITRIAFDPNKAHPCMVFRPLQKLTDAEAPVILELRADPTVARITTGEVSVLGLQAVAQALQPALAPPGAAPTGLTAVGAMPSTINIPPPNPQPVNVYPSTTQWPQSSGAATPTPMENPAPAPWDAAPPATVSSLSGLTVVQASPSLVPSSGGVASVQTASPSPVTTGDIGEAEMSDDALDLRIAGLIAKESR